MIQQPLSFSIIIPTWNRAHLLSKLLESIAAQQYPANKIEIIVVDSFSTDETAEVVKVFLRNNPEYHLRYLNTKINSPSKKRNIGILNASLDWLLFFDDDCALSENYFEFLVQSLLQINDSKAVFFGEVRYPAQLINNSNYRRYRDSRHFACIEDVKPVDFIKITTMNMAINLAELSKSEVLFDEDYSFSCEDTDFGFRLKKAGFNFFTSKASINHYESSVDIAAYLVKCRRVYGEGYRLVCEKDPSLAKKMIWKYITPKNNFLGMLHFFFLRLIFNKPISNCLVLFLVKTDSKNLFYSDKLFMYVILSAYIEGVKFR